MKWGMCARTNLRGRAYCLATVAVGLLNERVFLLTGKLNRIAVKVYTMQSFRDLFRESRENIAVYRVAKCSEWYCDLDIWTPG